MYKKIDKSRYTPMMQQYLDIKEQYPDTLIFFRLGDFYEMFFNDAIVASRELEIVLTGRDAGVEERVPMCGVPHHSVDGYIERLTNKGYKVGIVEQLEEAGNKKIVKRDVVRIVTPGTNIDEKYLDDKSNNYIGALTKQQNKYLLSYIELSTGESRLSYFEGNLNIVYSEIQKLKIREIVVKNSLSKSVVNHLQKVYNILVSIEENKEIDQYLTHLLADITEDDQENPQLLLNYLLKTQKRVLVHLQPFKYYRNDDFLKLDSNVVKNLELIESLRGSKNRNNLFAVLDRCATAMGSRHLKNSILYPMINLKQINYRLDLIEEFHLKYLQVQKIKEKLLEVYDLERIIGRISYGSLSPKDLIQLKRSLSVLPDIKKTLEEMQTQNCYDISTKIELFNDLYHLLESAIDDGAGYSVRDGGVIKSGFNSELDNIRTINNQNKDFLVNLEIRERERTGIKNLKVGYNKVFGYYIEITKSYLSQVKEEFGYIRKQTTSNSERYITQELKEREALILRSGEISINLEIKLFNDIREQCCNYIRELQKLAYIISEIDLIYAFAIVSIENNYTRPTFSHYDEVEIINGRHPVIEVYGEQEFIPNDFKLYNNERILLITGPNMSGKSTYMRQNALIIIMAQMGCFVPANMAKVPIFDQIFTRIGSSDDITSGESTFMNEMLEVNYALTNATERSLIILDEVGRGTATFDGMALAQAIIEYIHDEIGAKTCFSTHYHELTSLETSLSFLRNVHVEALTDELTSKIIFMHKVLPGPTDESYGINVASLANIPPTITIRAKDLLDKLEQKSSYDSELLSPLNYQKPVIIDHTNPISQEIINQLLELNIDDVKPIEALMILAELVKKVN